jgi:ATP-binding cassette subfamily B protein
MYLLIKQKPFGFFVYITMVLAVGILSGFTIFANDGLFNAITDITRDQGALHRVYVYVGLVIAIKMALQTISTLNYGYSQNVNNHMHRGMSVIIHAKKAKIPAVHFESKAMLEIMHKANQGVFGAEKLLQTIVDILFNQVAYFIIVGVFLWQMRPILLISFLFVYIPVALSQLVQARIYSKQADEIAPLQRQEGVYFQHAMNERETRLFGVFSHFHTLVKETKQRMFDIQWQTHKKTQYIQSGLNLVKMIGWVGIILLLYQGMLSGYIQIGSFAAVFLAINTMFNNFERLFSQVQQNVAQQMGHINNLVKYLAMDEVKDVQGGVPEIDKKGIVATNVSFAYPEASYPAVADIYLSIPPGQSVAIVGENGSGKTTLVKLLCGLYKPNSGTVVVGGIDTCETGESLLFAHTSAVFQNYGEYHIMSIKDNVKISDVASGDEAFDALMSAGIEYENEVLYPNGADTLLTPDLNGTSLSGGQWQRLAIARGIFRKNAFIIMDEPTAAIDPLEETRIYNLFAKIAKGKCTLLVTHRLGAARLADKIIVMSKGRIVENGTHEELLAKKNVYADMWNIQSSGLATV